MGEAPTERGTAPFVPPGLEIPVPLQQPPPMPKIEPLVPTDEQITAFLLNQKKLKANKKREQMSNLFKKALPQ